MLFAKSVFHLTFEENIKNSGKMTQNTAKTSKYIKTPIDVPLLRVQNSIGVSYGRTNETSTEHIS